MRDQNSSTNSDIVCVQLAYPSVWRTGNAFSRTNISIAESVLEASVREYILPNRVAPKLYGVINAARLYFDLSPIARRNGGVGCRLLRRGSDVTL